MKNKHLSRWAITGSRAVLDDKASTAAMLSQRNQTLFPLQLAPHMAALATIGRSSLAAMQVVDHSCGHSGRIVCLYR